MKKGILINVLIFFTLIAASCVVGQNHVADNNNNTAITDNRQQMLQSIDSADQNHIADSSTAIKANNQPTPKLVANSAKSSDYEIIKRTYTDRKITINYPQIAKMKDREKQEKINKIIEEDALHRARWCTNPDAVYINIDYEIKFATDGLLSIKYAGISDPQGTPHPTYVFYTTNINIREASRLRLKDVVYIDNNFVEKVKKGKLIAVSPEITFEKLHYTNEKLITAFNKADVMSHVENGYGVYMYFTNDSLGISVEIAYVFGDHAEFEVKYRDIADNINLENKVWKEFFD